jgi:DNA-binding transcriptional regulator PaaX
MSKGANITVKVLKVVAAGPLMVGVLVAPNAVGPLLKLIINQSGLRERQARTALRYAKEKDWYEIKRTKAGNQLVLTAKGRQKLTEAELNEPIMARAWDKKWRILIFDIPKSHNRARDQFRLMLKRMGFKQLQASAWIIPYPCSSHVEAAANILGISRFIQVFETAELNNESLWRQKFNL